MRNEASETLLAGAPGADFGMDGPVLRAHRGGDLPARDPAESVPRPSYASVGGVDQWRGFRLQHRPVPGPADGRGARTSPGRAARPANPAVGGRASAGARVHAVLAAAVAE